MIFKFTSQAATGRNPSALARLQRRLAPRPGKATGMDIAPGATKLMQLSKLSLGQRAVIDEIMLTGSALEQVMLFGFIPGVEVVAGHAGPGGDPRVYRVDGTEVAVRRETARHVLVRPLTVTPASAKAALAGDPDGEQA
ncbi:MAG: FeoA family protein [Candidatus Korobacteraceae bacterium]|jgi:ferrous iron transport protein A